MRYLLYLAFAFATPVLLLLSLTLSSRLPSSTIQPTPTMSNLAPVLRVPAGATQAAAAYDSLATPTPKCCCSTPHSCSCLLLPSSALLTPSLTHSKLSTAVCCFPAASLHISKPTWWLESRFHFSFADYWDPNRMSFGALRVVNDDFVQPRAGFGTHPHRDAEIFSYVLDGQLSH